VHYALASVSYLLLFHLLRYRRRVVRDNLRHAFPTLAPERRRQIEKESYRHFCDLAFEVIRSSAMPQAEFNRRMRFVNLDLLRRMTDEQQRQALVLLIHQGNWEWALHAVMAELGVPVDPVYKTLHSPLWNDFMLDARSRFGARPMALPEVGRAVVRRRRERRLIVMLADQSGPRSGYWTDFLNRPASFHRGAEKLAQSLALPLLFARCRRLRRGYYEMEFLELSLPPHEASGDELLRRYVDTAEEAIRAQPETYLWTNRRWKKQPPEPQ